VTIFVEKIMVLSFSVAFICNDITTCLIREFAMKVGFHSNAKKSIFIDDISEKRIKNRFKDMLIIKEENKNKEYCSVKQ